MRTIKKTTMLCVVLFAINATLNAQTNPFPTAVINEQYGAWQFYAGSVYIFELPNVAGATYDWSCDNSDFIQYTNNAYAVRFEMPYPVYSWGVEGRIRCTVTYQGINYYKYLDIVVYP